MRIAARVTSSTNGSPILRVTARVGDRLVSLDNDKKSDSWTGTFPLYGLPAGTHTLILRAEEWPGEVTGTAQYEFTVAPPALRVISPTGGDVLSTEARMSATCMEDDPLKCVSLEALFAGEVVARCTREDASCVDEKGTLKLDRVVSLAAYRPELWGVQFRGATSNGTSFTSPTIMVHKENLGAHKLLAQVPGLILDAQSDRILYKAYYGSPNPFEYTTPFTVRIRDLATGQDTTVLEDSDAEVEGLLTPHGAVLYRPSSQEKYHFPDLYEWRDGQLLKLATDPRQSYETLWIDRNWIERNYAAFYTADGPVFRDLVSGKDTKIPALEGRRTLIQDVAPNGDVLIVYYGDQDQPLYRWRAGELTQVVPDTHLDETGTFHSSNSLAKTDGSNVGYFRRSGDFTFSFYLHRPSPPSETLLHNEARTPVLMNNGWIAYVGLTHKTEFVNYYGVWVRSPEGVTKLVSQTSTFYRLDDLSPEGEVAYYSNDGGLYLSGFNRSGEQLIRPAHANPYYDRSKMAWMGGKWHWIVNGSVFDVGGATTKLSGDANLDGKIDVEDVTLALRATTQSATLTTEQHRAADVDMNGSVNVSDAIKILRLIVGLDSSLGEAT